MDFDIISKDNLKIKYIKKLISQSSFRRNEKNFVVEGIRLCYDAFLSKAIIAETYYTESAALKYAEKINQIMERSQKAYKIPDNILKKISDTQNPQGIVCVCKELDKQFSLDKINSVGKFIILQNIQDPSNLGTIIRTAEAIGISGIIMSNNCCDVYNSKVLRGSMGAVFRIPIYSCENLCEAIGILNSKGIKTYAAVPERSAIPITKINLKEPIAIAIGNEGNGLTKEIVNVCELKITIPMIGRAESLNAAMAAGIIMWEMMRGEEFNGL